MNFLGLARRIVSSSYQIKQLLSANGNQSIKFLTARSISVTSPRLEEEKKYDVNEDVNKKLMQFFDEEKNWNENEVKHGRSWSLPELRIKSNMDIHKIWYVLLKERNMLKTMEHEHNREWKFWASPERIDKVQESMNNIETVVRERNKAYFELETGRNGERPGRMQYNIFGLKEYKKFLEHKIPYHLNKKWQQDNPKGFNGYAVRKFLRLYREKLYLEKKKERNRHNNHIIRLLRRNPHISDETIAERYPTVNLGYIRNTDKHRGHFIPKVD